MDTQAISQPLVVVPDDNEQYLTMPQQEFVELYCQPIMDDTWIRTQDIVHMSDLVETEGGERIKQEILHDHIQERAKTGQYRQDPILEGMLWQEQFMDDYQQSGERTQDTEQALSYRARIMEQFRARNPNRRASNAAAIDAIMSPSKSAPSGGQGSAVASPDNRPPTGTAPADAATPAAPASPSGRPDSPMELDARDLSGQRTDNTRENAAASQHANVDDPQYAELSSPARSTPASPKQVDSADAAKDIAVDEAEADDVPPAVTGAYPTEAGVYPTEEEDTDEFAEL